LSQADPLRRRTLSSAAVASQSTTEVLAMGIMRRRMRRRVLVAGAATGAVAYHEGKKHAQRDQEADEPEQTDYAPAPPQDTGPDAGDLDQIQKLAELHESGALTDAEFATAKAKLLA
jgi:hypothetical protein